MKREPRPKTTPSDLPVTVLPLAELDAVPEATRAIITPNRRSMRWPIAWQSVRLAAADCYRPEARSS